MTLRFLAQGSYQQSVGMDFMVGMAQSSVSEALWETLDILESCLCPKNINMEITHTEKIESKQWFYDRTGFPGIIGAIDGTHVNIIRPNKDEHLYFNRKGCHSINVMVVSLVLCILYLHYSYISKFILDL